MEIRTGNHTKKERKETMKKTRFSKIAALLLALTLAVGVLLGVSVASSAANAAPYIGYANVQWGEEIRIAFTIVNPGEDANLGIAVYKDAEKTDLLSVDFSADEEYDYYLTDGIAAKDIDTTYYVVVVQGNYASYEIVSETVLEYSVDKYMTAMADSASAAQLALYEKVRAYNAAANKIFE